jgi:hypothetical protein
MTTIQRYRMPSLKIIKILLWSVTVAVFSGCLFLFAVSKWQTETEDPAVGKGKTGYGYARPAHRIKDFTYTSHVGEKKEIFIQCSYLTVSRKKIKGIRLGLIKEAVLVNGVIRLYQYPRENNRKSPEKTEPDQNSTSQGAQKPRDVLEAIAAKDSPLVSSFKNVVSVSIHPVVVELYTHNQLATKITARSAVFDLTQRVIIFSGRVHVFSENRELILDRLTLNPENKQLTGTDYRLITPDGNTSGKQIITDLYLGKINE